jgi:hypothetical protein
MKSPNSHITKTIIASCISVIPLVLLWIYAQPFAIILLWLLFLPMLLSIVSGLFRGLICRRWETLRFAFQIFGGNLIIKSNSRLAEGIMTVVSRVIWEQPQTLMGNFGMHVLNIVWLLKRVDVWKHTLVCQGTFLNGGGIALGSYIMIDIQDAPVINIFPMDERVVPEKVLIRHEYGHSLQSIASGPLYIFKYGIPSILMQGWTESDADFRSDRELLKSEQIMPVFTSTRKIEGVISPSWWEFSIAPILMTAGWFVNQVDGLIGGILFSTVIITLINLKKPA